MRTRERRVRNGALVLAAAVMLPLVVVMAEGRGSNEGVVRQRATATGFRGQADAPLTAAASRGVEAESDTETGWRLTPVSRVAAEEGPRTLAHENGDLDVPDAHSNPGAQNGSPVWRTETVDGAGNVGLYTSIALDVEDRPHISYYDGTDGALMYARHDGTRWITETVDAEAGDGGGHTSLALDAAGRPRISYCRRDSTPFGPAPVTYLRYASYDGAAWQLDTIESIGADGGDTSLALDSEGYPYISTYSSDNGALKVAQLLRTVEEPTWVSEVVDGFVHNVGRHTSIAVGDDGCPRVSYVDLTHHHLKFARWHKGDWQIETVDGEHYVDGATSLALDADGRPRISYHDAEMGVLRYALSDGLGEWKTGLVDGSAEVGWYNSLDLGVDEEPWIGYYNATDDDLKAAWLNSGGWISRTVDSGGIWDDLGRYVSLRLDSIGNPHLSYYHAAGGDVLIGNLKYAAFDVTAPVIVSGPVVLSTTQATALIAWETDEACDSEVRFGSNAGVYDLQVEQPGLVEMHEVKLTGLQPSTVYHFLVRSTDAARNAVVSSELFFETVPMPDGEPPSVSTMTLTRGAFDIYTITAPVKDAGGVERVAFYMDDVFIGSDYAGTSSRYAVPFAPYEMGLSRKDFFSGHTFEVRAFDHFGHEQVLPEWLEPLAPPMEGSLVIEEPVPGYIYYIDGDETPTGALIRIRARAAQYDWHCLWDMLTVGDDDSQESFEGGGAQALSYDASAWTPMVTQTPIDPIGCHELRTQRPVSYVLIYADDQLIRTSYPTADDDFSHGHNWLAHGLSPGSYQIRVEAYNDAGQKLVRHRQVEVVQGAGLEVSRSAARIDNYLSVSLTITNNAPIGAVLLNVRDTVRGFQPIRSSLADNDDAFEVTTHCSLDADECDVDITPAGWVNRLDPGESLTVSYLAVPILYRNASWSHAIGAEPVQIEYHDDQGDHTRDFHVPCYTTEDGGVNPVLMAKFASNYLIVTNPFYLRAQNYGQNEEVDVLLSTMAKLALLKGGILGYTSGYVSGEDVWDPATTERWIEWWGGMMEGSDGSARGYLSNGYLLIVGETEVVPSWHQYGFSVDWSNSPTTHDVDLTDLPYADTGGSGAPELIAGRLIGDSAAELTAQLEASIGVYTGDSDHLFGRDRALLVSGTGCCEGDMVNNVNDVEGILVQRGFWFPSKIHWRDHISTTRVSVFTDRANAGEWDVYFLTAHGSAQCCGELCGWHLDDVDFGQRHPFVYGSSCSTGHYEHGGLAERFLERGAGVYLGSTQVSAVTQNCTASRWMFDSYWGPGDTVGRALRDLKRNRWGHGEYWTLWAWEYNLYGDPAFGAVPPAAVTNAGKATGPLGAPTSPLSITVPDYQVSEVDGLDRVEIPGGDLTVVEGEPEVPIWAETFDYPPGQQVQAVTLIDRAGLVFTTGLTLPLAYQGVACSSAVVGRERARAETVGWYPEDVYDWHVIQHQDGSSTLTIVVYPFYYNAQTTGIRFYKTYSFGVDVITSTVNVELLTTDKDVYAQNEDVQVDLWLNNSGDPQDVIVDAAVVEEVSGEVVDGLMLKSLHHVQGLASWDTVWDSGSAQPGAYAIEVEIRDDLGNVLDRTTRRFELGIHAGEVTSFSVTPAMFNLGDTLDISMIFSNTGTVPITGTAVVEIQHSSVLTMGTALTRTIANLGPRSDVVLEDEWDTSGAEEGAYQVRGYVLYHSTSTEPASVLVGTQARITLPLVLRGQ